jgi:hypothetical protein
MLAHEAKRARLALEILLAYVCARRAIAGAPITIALARLRGESVEPPPTVPATARVRIEEAHRLGRAVARTLAFVPGDTRCLVRSLVLARLLARRGIPAKLVIGTRAAPDFLAHAWVECAGDPVLSTGDGSFGRLVEL